MKIEFSLESWNADLFQALSVAVLEEPLTEQPLFRRLQESLGLDLAELLKLRGFSGEADESLEILGTGALKGVRIQLLGMGKAADLTPVRLRNRLAIASRWLRGTKVRKAALGVPDANEGRVIGEAVLLGTYRFTKYLTGERAPEVDLEELKLLVAGKKLSARAEALLDQGLKVGRAVCMARDAVNEPPNELTPAELARRCEALAAEKGMGIRILDAAGIRAEGMWLHDAVGRGSRNEPRFIHLMHRPERAKKKLVFVGKGLTFDSGGLCIKPAAGMGEMKSDMAGAAAVLGLMAAVADLNLPVEVHGLIGAAENMPDGNAYRPGDIFRSYDGKTVEIVNTDAEGRLVLADALTYGKLLEPDVMIDTATLTGACMVALGKSCSGVFTDDDELAERTAECAKFTGEGFWRLPLLKELRDSLKSDVADLQHTGDRWGGAITAALFLKEFVGDVRWMHVDIAGPSFSDRVSGVQPKGGTGHPVLTYVRLVESYAKR